MDCTMNMQNVVNRRIKILAVFAAQTSATGVLVKLRSHFEIIKSALITAEQKAAGG